MPYNLGMGFFRRLFLALAGLVALTIISFASLTATTFAQDQVPADPIQSGLCSGADLKVVDGNSSCDTTSEGGAEKLNRVVRSVINTLSLIVGVVAVIMIIIGGLRYITSGGSDTSVTSAKNTILYAIIGLIIVALSQIMVRFVLKQLTG